MKYIIVFLSFIFCFSHSFAQLPETEIYLFDLRKTPKGYVVSNPKVVAPNSGYNNQPYFSPDGKYLYFVSSVKASNTEIYRYDLQKKKAKRITRTKTNEYSPKYTTDQASLTSVVVEEDSVTQHFYINSLKRKNRKNILPKLTSIGYYEWLNVLEFVSFELPEPFFLVKHHITNATADTLASNIGRTFYYLKNKGLLSYIDKSDSSKWRIKTISSKQLARGDKQKVHSLLANTLPNEEDYCFLQDGSIFMGHEGKMFVLRNPFKNPNAIWTEVINFKPFGIDKFYRLATSSDNTKLAIVVYKGKKP